MRALLLFGFFFALALLPTFSSALLDGICYFPPHVRCIAFPLVRCRKRTPDDVELGETAYYPHVSLVAFSLTGLAAIGRPGYINLGHGDDMPPSRSVDAMRAHALAVMDEAYALGLRYFDCARSYGHPPAAQRLARAQLKAGEEYARQHL